MAPRKDVTPVRRVLCLTLASPPSPQVLGWAPSITLKEGLEKTAPWILARIADDKAAGITENYSSSTVVAATTVSAIGSGPDKK